jgi:hypothetical protein
MNGVPQMAQAHPVLRWALTVVLGCLALTWVHLVAVGGFDLRLPYALSIGLGLCLFLAPTGLARALKHLPGWVGPWLGVYLVYLLVLQLGFLGGPSNGMIVRQAFFLICGLTLAVALVAANGDPRALRRGGLLCLVTFLAVTEVLGRQIGVSWSVAVVQFVTSGDLNFLFYKFLRAIFELAAPAGTEVPASEKNAAAVAIFTGLILFRAGFTGAGVDRFGQAVTLVALIVLVMLNTRSVLMIAALGLPLAALIGAVRTPRFSVTGLLFKGLAVLAGLVLVAVILSGDNAAVSIIEDRFAFGDVSTGARFEQYDFAMMTIEANWLTGVGLAEAGGHVIHNLFLGAWMHAGIGAFLLVSVTYLTLVGLWARMVLRCLTDPTHWVHPARPEWVALLPLLPFFRMWIAGDAGHPSYGEWAAIFAFFGLTLSNRLLQVTESRERIDPRFDPVPG